MQYEPLLVEDTDEVSELMEVFAEAFEDDQHYRSAKPSKQYMEALLRNPLNIVLVAKNDEGAVVGGLVAYELQKFEQERSEIYLYDLAVAQAHRRRGIATKLIMELVSIARERGAYVVFVQADNEDAPAVTLYTKLASSIETEVTHFDISVSDS